MKPVIGVLALQGDVPEHLRALEAVGGLPVPVRRPEELHRIDGLVIPGGESTTLWRALRRPSTCWSRCASSSPAGCPRLDPVPG